jgi:hypothetical protein
MGIEVAAECTESMRKSPSPMIAARCISYQKLQILVYKYWF